MTINVAFNPLATSVASGTFNVNTEGYIQGTALDNPSARFQLAGGFLASTETIPMWGGVAISEAVPSGTTDPSSTQVTDVLGGPITRATQINASASSPTAGDVTGFSVFDQNYAGWNFPGNPVPSTGNYGLVNFYRLGSLARIAVPCSAGVANDEGSIITSKLSWDFNANNGIGELVLAESGNVSQTTITNAVWAATSGGQITFTVSSDLTGSISAGDTIDVAAITSTPTGVFNGTWQVVSINSTTIVVTAPGGLTSWSYTSGGHVDAFTNTILPVKLLNVNIGNSMTVTWASSLATWNRSGNVAIILI